MPGVDLFMDEVVADFRRRLALLGDGGDRRAIEDGIALLAGLRLSGIDAAAFEELLSRLRAGRAPGRPLRAATGEDRRRARATLAALRGGGRGPGAQLGNHADAPVGVRPIGARVTERVGLSL